MPDEYVWSAVLSPRPDGQTETSADRSEIHNMNVSATLTDVRPGVSAGILAGLPVLAVVLYRYDDPSSIVRSPGILVGFLLVGVVGSLVVTGVPAALFVRYRLVTPVLAAGAVLCFWLLLAQGGDAPGVMFVVVPWPLYLGLYAVLAVVEYAIRYDQSVIPFLS